MIPLECQMDPATPITSAEVIATLRAREAVLRAAGIRALSLFGSVARGDARSDSDIDLAVEFDPAAKVDLFRMIELELELGAVLGRRVEILPEPVESARLRSRVEKDRVRAF
jgi:predicted nucleotidyltransferase